MQPDALLLIEPRAGGRSRLSADDYVEGAPELIVEIAATQRSDRSARQAASLPSQRRAGVRGVASAGAATRLVRADR